MNNFFLIQKRFYLTAIIFCLGLSISFAQGTLRGSVSADRSPLAFATISVAKFKLQTASGLDGQFSLSLPEGQHQISISMVGYRKVDTLVNILKGKTTYLNQVNLAAAADLEQVVIKGMYSSSERKAVAMRRNSTAIMDVASADAIGKLPDINAAEAVQRIPGVSIDRDQGEGRYVTVRGTPSQWSSTTINGDRMPAAKTSGDLLGNRTVPMDLLPSEFIQYIQVVKAITPEYEGDAIGGTINFITRTSPEKRTFRVMGALPYAERPKDKFGYNGSVLYGDRSLNDKLGFLVLGSINQRTYGTDDYEVVYGSQLHNVTTLDVRNYQGTRTNKGLNASLDYRLMPGTKLYARGYYTELLDNERNRKTMHYFDRATNNAVLRWNIVDYYFKNYGGEAGIESVLAPKLSMNARFAWYKSWAGYKGPSSVTKDLRGYYYGNWVQTVKYDNLVNIGGKDYKFLNGDGPAGYEGDEPNNIQTHFSPSTPYSADNYYLDRFVTSIRNITENDQVAAVDFKYQVLSNLLLKFGGKFRYKTSAYDYRYVTWIYKSTAPKAYLPLWEKEAFPAKNWFPELNNAYDNLKFDYPTAQSFIDPNSIPAVTQNLTYTLNDASNSSYATGNYQATEKVGAGYLMGEWDLRPQLKMVGGMRFEYTSDLSNSFLYNDITKKVSPVSGSKQVPAVLPMLHLIYKPNDQTDIRAAVTRTFARPAFNEISPTTRVNPNTLTTTLGNPDLRPTFSWNYDLIGSYYLNTTSYLTGGLFYKKIRDAVYTQSFTQSQTVDGTTANFQVSQPLNSDNAMLYGFELGYNQKFTFLPGLLSGIGLSLNYTYTKSETTLDDRPGEKIGLLNQSPNIVNAALFYEKDRFSFRIAANYRQAFLVEVRDNSGADRYQDKDFHLDINTSYNLPKNITVFLDANNLTNAPLRYYHGVKSRPEQVEYYSARGRIGVNWSF
ncbi:TonB-dependent receptor [Pedobacter sp. MC2016-24]|uniref:TonB-dependent receptor n=1 Tax=Pedobacter sp. MC2016-24 TaxID=2780090 RepID=UPI001880FE6B|nr:TonB-dependent receptor [Pedobacter sp. MC2016-24]MBE9601699.1 TonB-dependent receptor [Pedobacter sp. MC2016-24]